MNFTFHRKGLETKKNQKGAFGPANYQGLKMILLTLAFRGFEKETARLDSPECFFNSIGPDLQKKRDAIAKVLEDVGMNPVVPEGGYFIMADWSKFADQVRLHEY